MPSRSPPAVQGGILEGLFTKGPTADPELTRRLLPLGFDVHDIQPTYPPKVLLDCVLLAAEYLWPELPPEERLRRLGGLTVQGFQQTVLGSITLAAIRLMGPERLIKQLPKRFFSGQNYGSGRVEQLEPRRWEVHYLEIPPGLDPNMPFVCGAIEAAVRLTDVRNPRVKVVREVPNGFVMEVTWEA